MKETVVKVPGDGGDLKARCDLIDYLEFHESDIADNIDDFGKLEHIFEILLNRKAGLVK